MKSYVLILLALLATGYSLNACKKKKINYKIEGKITDTSFSLGIANLTLKVELKKAGNAYYSFLTNVTTDSQGKYSFSIENDLYEKVKITANPDNYFPLERIFAYGNLNQENNIYNINTSAKSWARLIFINNNPNSSDHLQYLKQQGKINCAECCPSDEQNLFGAINDTIICINDGNTYYSYLYSVVGTSNTGIEAVYTSAFDTTTLLLYY
jgi:hypothetical protein